MQQEVAQEPVERSGLGFLFVVVGRIAPAKGDLAIGKRNQTMIGDGHAMGVAAEILQYLFGATEGTFRVHHAVLSEPRP